MSGAISQRSKVSLFTLKQQLNIDESNTAHDAWLKRKLEQAKSLADGFCNNPFVDEETGEEIPLRPEIDHWIEELVARWFVLRENGSRGESIPGEGSSQFGEVDYTGLQFAKRYLI